MIIVNFNPIIPQEDIQGEGIRLRQATIADRQMIYDWLAHSDLTKSMMGPPEFPEIQVPTWEDFFADYTDVHFSGDDPAQGRSFIIELDGTPIGHVNHGVLHEDGSTELDIWLAGSAYTGHGYGTEALRLLCAQLHNTGQCQTFYIAPSLRNRIAIRSYLKAGFEPTDNIPEWFIPDYADTIVLVRKETH